VLFTRSKKRMHIFSSMNSDEIVVGPTSKRGVRALRDFLDFCETGMPHKTRQMIERSPASDFEIAVISALHKEGFESIPQVGVAGFFIDVAVVDPGNPGRYLMGIECDGTTYHSAKSVRDRDRLRQTILERLGWRIRRIWSTDWYKNPQGELIAIIRELHELKSAITPIEVEPESEVSEIEEIIQEVDIEETQVVPFAFEKKSLKEKLIQFDREVIQKAFPETAENKRLLRPAMLEALLQYTPTSRVEFLEAIPSYMREAVEETENNYLDQVFGIINASLDEI
jgi:very-short-patch-repair endonuclease